MFIYESKLKKINEINFNFKSIKNTLILKNKNRDCPTFNQYYYYLFYLKKKITLKKIKLKCNFQYKFTSC